MDAVTAVFKKIALVLSLALLAAMPRLAQAAAPSFTSPTSSTLVTLSGTSGSVNVTGSEDSNTPATPITFLVFVSYQNGDRPWLQVGSDPTATPGGLCNGGGGNNWTYETPAVLTMGVNCSAAALSTGLHTATVMLTGSEPAGVSSVTFTVQYNTNGGSTPTLVPTPSSLTGSNAMTAVAGSSVSTTVDLQTTSSTAIGFTTATSVGWLTVKSTTNQVTNNIPTALTFTANSAGLSLGANNATVTISYGSNQSLLINVTFNVTSSGVTLSPSTLGWSYSNSALSPSSAQNVTLGTPNNDSYSAAISYPSGATGTNWLRVNNGTSASGLFNGSELSISVVNYTTLAVGTYSGTVTVTDTDNSSNTASLTVTLTVSGSTSGGLTISPNPISLNSTSSPAYQQLVTVTSTTGGAFTATSSASWLSAGTSANSIIAGGSAFLTVTANTSVSGSGTFTGSITVQVGSVSQQVVVNLTAGSGAGGTNSGYVAPTTLNLVAQSGGAAVKQELVFAGSGSFSIANSPVYSSDGNVAWLESGQIGGNMNVDGTPVTMTANPAMLTPGTYTATVGLAITANGVPVNPSPLQVNFVVTSGEALTVVSPASGTLLLNSGAISQTATIQIASSGSTALPVDVATDQNWLSASIQGGATNTPATISVTANSNSLSNGLYSGNVIVTGGSEQALYVPVVLVVSGAINPSGLTLSATSMTFSAAVGGSAPSQLLTVSSSPTGTVFSATASVSSPAGGNWLSISPSSGNLTTNQNLTVSVNPSGLAAGNYSGAIGLSANGTSVTVQVNLVVGSTSGGNVTVSASTLNFTAVAGGSAPATQALTVSSAAGSAGVPFTAAASSTGNWLSVSPASGTTQTNLTVSVNQADLSAGNHSGSITITPTGGSAVVVQVTLDVLSQPEITVTPASLSFSFQAGSGGTVAPGQLTVSASGGVSSFQASASSTGNWLSVTPASGSTSTTTQLTVQVNPAGLAASTTPYTGTITITGVSGTEGSATVTVSLSVTAPLPSITGVTNAASFASGAVSPGEIVSIFGTSIGPTNPATLTLTSAGTVSTSIGGVTVSFSGYLAPLTYVGSTQINAVVPYGIAGNKEPFVEVKFAGQTSNDFTLTLATSAPGIFTQNSSGTGPGAILNGDSSGNTQQNPAAPGSTIQIFMTGEGLTTPAQATGAVTPVNLTGSGPITPAPQLPVMVMIGGQPAQLTFAGEAPYTVAGVLQVDAVIPPTTGAGAIPITVQVGKQISQTGVTVWVK
ncbi:MAG: BACON domain-containing carbohydrate-binding protein [Bryobacteraceae bacterium]|jgi:uncharacterized protein (TIGR03437 family)